MSLIGKAVSQSRLAEVINAMPVAGLGGARLRAYQSVDQRIDVATLRSSILSDLSKASKAELDEKVKALSRLQSEVDTLNGNGSRLYDIASELTAIYPQLHDVVRAKGERENRLIVLSARTKRRLRDIDQKRLEKWQTARTGVDCVRVVPNVQ